MKFCTKCGKEIHDEAVICIHCGTTIGTIPTAEKAAPPRIHRTPKCTCCGHIGEWKVGPILRPVDWIIGLCGLLCCILPGLSYLITVAIIRSNEKRREKICTKCGGRNLFTFEY